VTYLLQFYKLHQQTKFFIQRPRML